MQHNLLKDPIFKSPFWNGYISGCETIDAIDAMQLLLERHRKKNTPAHVAFLDVEKALDRVPCDLIWYALWKQGIPAVYVSLIKFFYQSVSSVVRSSAG